MADDNRIYLTDLCNTVIKHQNGHPDKFLLSQKVTNLLLDIIQSDTTQRDIIWKLMNESTKDSCPETGLFEILLQQCVLKCMAQDKLFDVLLGAEKILSKFGSPDSCQIFLLCIGIAEKRPECKVSDLLTKIDKELVIATDIQSFIEAERDLEASQMGNKNSLRVNYKALNESCEQFAQQDEDRRQRLAERNEEVSRQQAIAMPRRKPYSQRRLERSYQIDPDTEDSSDSRSEGLRNFQSMPNVSEELEQHFEATSSPPRERRQTISQPICIPGSTKTNPQISNLTIENVQLNSMQNSDIPSVLSFAVTESFRSTSDMQSPNVELVKCDDIVIHFDSMQSPNTTTPTTSQEAKSSPYATSIHDPSYLTRFLSPKYDKQQYLATGESSRRIGSAPPDFMSDFNPRRGEKIPRQRNLSTGLDGSVPPSAGFGYFPRPQRGQSLVSFLQTVHFSNSNSELESENAHFHICQAVSCAIQQLKWNRRLKKFHDSRSDSQCTKSSPDRGLNASNVPSHSGVDFDEEKATDPDQDTSSINNSNDSDVMSVSTMNIAACAAYAEWPEVTQATTSVEGIALSLLVKFNDRELPKAADLNWMVFDSHGSQNHGYGRGFGNNGEGSGPESSLGSSFCRGTSDWAPPRAQIIFTRRRLSSKKKVLEEQKNRCRGCGMYATADRISKMRLCGYTDHYYCTGCHRNQMSVIPARVLDEWDFKLQPVSVFAYRFLEDIWTNPVFNVETINAALYDRIRVLNRARELRSCCRLLRNHLLACRFFLESEPGIFENIPDYFTNDTDLWSMANFVAVKDGSLVNFTRQLIKEGEAHILQCELCLARGFICEVCRSDSIVFPWQLNVRQCPNCGACTHFSCNDANGSCSKCDRIRQRV